MEILERNDSRVSLYINLKNAAFKRPRLRMWGYTLGEYLYVLGRDSLTLHDKTSSVSQEDNDFLE